MKKAKWIVIGVTALCLVGPSVGLAGDKHGPIGFFKELNLTKDQKEKLKKLREEEKEDRKAAREKMKEEAKAFREKMAGQASDDDLRKDFSSLQSKRSEMAKSRFEHMLKVRAILTPEQRKKFSEVMDQKMKHHKSKGHKHPRDEDREDDEE